MHRLLLPILLLAVACNSPDSDREDGGLDGGADAGSTADAGSDDAGPDAGPDGGVDAGSDDAGSGDGGSGDAGADGGGPLIAARPYEVTIPPAYDGSTALPLVVLLHGFGADAASQDLYFGMSALARQQGFFVALPDGRQNPSGMRFWNATDACCAYGEPVDDVAYLSALLDDLEARFLIDSKRIFFVGHSNGGFMSHRMACDRAGRVAAIVSLAGAVWQDETLCAPTEPVSVLQVHGGLDAIILYGGGFNYGVAYPGAVETVETWASKNGCQPTVSSVGPDIELVSDLITDETTRMAHEGCPATGAAELWRIGGGSHMPTFNPTWSGVIYDWLMAHPKP